MYESGVFTNLDAPKSARTRYFRKSTNRWAISHGFPYQLTSQHTEHGAPVKFGKTRAYVVIDEGEGGQPIVETWRISGLQFWNENPLSRTSVAADSQRPRASRNAKGKTTTTKAPSRRLMARRRTTEAAPKGFYANPLTRVKINSPSIATGEPPSERLKKRRRKTAKAPAGIWANPITALPKSLKTWYEIQCKTASGAAVWNHCATAGKRSDAVAIAKALADIHPSWTIRVITLDDK